MTIVMDGDESSGVPDVTPSPRSAPPTSWEAPPEHTYKLSTIGVSILSFWVIFLTLLVIFLVWYLYRHRRRIVLMSPAVRRKKIERRYITTENWLVTKRVYRHSDSLCQFCKDGYSKSGSSKDDAKNASFETAASTVSSSHECSICFEEFKEGTIVSWSANPECPHVFCHTCIKEWMLRHSTCPSCRHVFLPTDYQRGHVSKEVLQGLSRQWGNRCRTTFFCETDGMVEVPLEYLEQGPKSTVRRLQRRILGSIVPAEDLAAIGRQDEVVDIHDDHKRGGDQDFDPLAEPDEQAQFQATSPPVSIAEADDDADGGPDEVDIVCDEEMGNLHVILDHPSER